MNVYVYDEKTKEFLYPQKAFLDPLETEKEGKEIFLLPKNATFTEPLPEKEGYACVWNGINWIYMEDHRQELDGGGVPIEGTGTPYWLPDDSWNTKPRYMKELGSLPEGSLREAPKKPLEQILLEEYEKELHEKELWLKEHDYIGVKIATQRATYEDYKEEINIMSQYAERVSELRQLIADLG